MNQHALEILIRAKNAASTGMASARNAIENFSRKGKQSINSFKETAKRAAVAFRDNWFAAAAAITALVLAVNRAKKVMLDWGVSASSIAEQLRLRLNAALQSVEEGNKLFSKMEKVAAKVSFEYKDIIEAATTLAGVMEGGRKEVERFIPVVLDLAAYSGLSVMETTSQIVRMYSAGAAAADLFRERGVLAMLGFQAGVSISATETRKKLIEAWEASDSKFRDLSMKMGSTWEGLLSMMADRVFVFKKMIGEAGFFEKMKSDIRGMISVITELGASGKLQEIAGRLSKAFTAFWNIAKTTIQLISGAMNGLGALFNTAIQMVTLAVSGYNKVVAQISFSLSILFSKAAEMAYKIPKVGRAIGDALMDASNAMMDFGANAEKGAGFFASWADEARKGFDESIDNLLVMDKLLNTSIPTSAEKAKEKIEEAGKSFGESWKEAWDTMKSTEKLVVGIAQSMSSTLSSALYDAFTGNLKSIQDYFASFGRAILQTISQVIAKLLVMKLLMGIAGGPKGKIFGVPISSISLHDGGMVRRAHNGVMARRAHNGMAGDEVPMIGLVGEGMLNRTAVNRLGGKAGIDAINSGGGAGDGQPQIVIAPVIQAWDAQSVMNNMDVIMSGLTQKIRTNDDIRKIIKGYA